jgi:hypothetical protein
MMPVNALLIRALLSFYGYYGDSFKIECPTGSGYGMNPFGLSRHVTGDSGTSRGQKRKESLWQRTKRKKTKRIRRGSPR